MNNYISKDPKVGGLPEELLRLEPNYHFLKHKITQKKDVTSHNSHMIGQKGPDGKLTEAMIAFRKGEVPESKVKPSFCFTGSSLSTALGLKLKMASKRFNSSFRGKPEYYNEFRNYFAGTPDEFKGGYSLDFGTHHEMNALYHLLKKNKIQMDLYETGPFAKNLSDKVRIISTPDGIFHHKNCGLGDYTEMIGIVEAKARSPYFTTQTGYMSETKCEVFEKPPYYYWPQIMMEMYVTDYYYAYFISWSPKYGSKVFLIERDEKFIDMMIKILLWVHDKYVIKKGTFSGDDPFLDISFEYEAFLIKLEQLSDDKHGCIVDEWEIKDNFEYNDIEAFMKQKEEPPKKKNKQ